MKMTILLSQINTSYGISENNQTFDLKLQLRKFN